MNAPQLTPKEVRAAVKRNMERGLAIGSPDGALYHAAAHVISAASVRADGDGELVPADSGDSVRVISQAADDRSRHPDVLETAIPLLSAIVWLVKELVDRRATLDDRQAQHLALAQEWITKYGDEAAPR